MKTQFFNPHNLPAFLWVHWTRGRCWHPEQRRDRVKGVQSYLRPESPARLPLGAPARRGFPKTLLSAFKSPAQTNRTQQRFLAWLSPSYKERKPLKALLNNVHKLPKTLFRFSHWTSGFSKARLITHRFPPQLPTCSQPPAPLWLCAPVLGHSHTTASSPRVWSSIFFPKCGIYRRLLDSLVRLPQG